MSKRFSPLHSYIITRETVLNLQMYKCNTITDSSIYVTHNNTVMYRTYLKYTSSHFSYYYCCFSMLTGMVLVSVYGKPHVACTQRADSSEHSDEQFVDN